jgi:predicted glycogen debranching enzyme
MISLPGLALTTKRYDEAKKILKAFTNYLDRGMLPNRFPDNNEKLEYNTVDATLWYFIAIYYFYIETKDKKFVLDYLYPKLISIVEWHEKGTRYNIHEDSDGLLWAGEEGVQLTWMDGKVDNWVVTPRIGKAVEINSLWFNAIKILEYLSGEYGKVDLADYYRKKSQLIKKSFNEKFWNTEGEYLFDVITNDYNDASVRPNQLFALSLPFPLVNKKKGEKILMLVKNELLTPFGLRSLSPNDSNYKGIYEGDQYNRDGAYHQGTVWSWLIGAYTDALDYIYGVKAKSKIQKVISDMVPHVSEACIGSISEIFDGDEPHGAKGAVAQAWSIAEFLRIYKKYNK